MDMTTFLGIEALGQRRYRVPVTNQLVTPGKFLYGGCGLAAAIQAMEIETGRPLAWATAQFASYASPGDVLELDVEIVAAGRNITQARVRATVEGREVLLAMGALGHGSHTEGIFEAMPETPAPRDCPRRESPAAVADTLFALLEIRLAAGRGWKDLDGTPGASRSSFWVRLPGHTSPTAATLGIVGDGVANGILEVTGRPMMGRSLDNTLRMASLVPTEWILVDIRMHAYVDGLSQGMAFLWAEDGTLLGTASQTQTIKPRPAGEVLWGGQRPVG